MYDKHEPHEGLYRVNKENSKNKLPHLVKYFVIFFLRYGIFSTSPNSKVGGPSLVGLFNIFAATFHISYPQLPYKLWDPPSILYCQLYCWSYCRVKATEAWS